MEDCFLKDQTRISFHGNFKGRKVYRNSDGSRFYTYDYTHNEVEVYNKRGVHIGVVDPVTEEYIKGAIKGRIQEV